MTSPPTYYDSKGRMVRVGDRIASGGESSVLASPTHPASVAKIYKTPPDELHAAKIRYMVAHQSTSLLKLAAWPTETLHLLPTGPVVGLLMPRINDARKIHELYNPLSRKAHFPDASWAFLVHAAANTARAIAVVHQYGHVVGDVNHSNLLVNPDGTVRLIDCDSFEIVTDDGRRFRCTVGVPDYTPPELIGKDFKSVTRTRNHDLFGLAVMVFHLLMLGRHPYAGRYRGGAEQVPMGQAIAEHRYAYGRDAARYQMALPPGAPSLDVLPPAVSQLFERAFAPTAGLSSAGRPEATEWIEGLTNLGRSLASCPRTDHHRYSRHRATCPWCALEQSSRTVAFPIPVGTAASAPAAHARGPNQPDIDVLWLAVEAVPRPGPAPTLVVPAAGIAPVSDEIRRLRNRANGRRGVIFIVLVVLEAGILIQSGFGWLPIVVLVIGLLVIRGVRNVGALGKARAKAGQDLATAETAWKTAEQAWETGAAATEFTSRVAHYGERRAAYRTLVEREKALIAETHATQERSQRDSWMARHLIANARITGIGPQRAATLAAHGIRSAADVDFQRILDLPGFGYSMSSNVTAWQTLVRGRFVFNPSAPEVTAATLGIRTQTDLERRTIERELAAGPQALRTIAARIEQHRTTLHAPAIDARQALEQARANRKALG